MSRIPDADVCSLGNTPCEEQWPSPTGICFNPKRLSEAGSDPALLCLDGSHPETQVKCRLAQPHVETACWFFF